ncbi:MAG: hypothetical protein GY847_32745 [Proteobacteria bacterium]|nr:hypothetical protein [Pseudomonadota bacterium]
MTTSPPDDRQTCPHCDKEVDPLRAPAVSIVDGRITHFCSPACRENHLRRSPELPAASVQVEPALAEETEPTPAQEPPAVAHRTSEAAQQYRSLLLKKQAFQVAALTAFLLAALVLPRFFDGLQIVALIGIEAFVLLVYGTLRERRLGAARMSEAAAVPLAAATVLLCPVFGTDPYLASSAAASLLLARGIGRLLELFGRKRSGVLATIEGSSHTAIPSSWRDNSSMAAKIRRVLIVLEWARYPAAALVGFTVFLIYSGSVTEALLSGATALVALSPRALRMATGDAHLAAALAASRIGVLIRDAHIVDQVAGAKIVLFMTKQALVEEHINIVDWYVADDVDEKPFLTALASIEAKAEGRIASAILEFTRAKGASEIPIEDIEVRAGLGIVGNTPSGRTICGSRSLFLGEGLSTALFEERAKTIEASGRRALFASVDGRVVSVFGAEETPVSNAQQVTQQLQLTEVEPVMLTSAEVSSAQALGSRLGIENVYFEIPEDDVGRILGEISATGANAVLVGHGPVFEENLRAAAAAVAIGGSDQTQAGVDARKLDVDIVPWIVKNARLARRSTEINLVAGQAATAVGLALSLGWFSPLVVTFAATLGFAAAALSTLNGPYPLIEQISDQIDSSLKKIKKTATRTWARIR